MTDASFFTANRKRLLESTKGGLVVLTAYQQMQRGNDAAHAFEQEANFWYLTGITAPDWQLIIDGIRHKSWLVAPDVDATHAIFEGSLAWDDARQASGIDDIITRKQADDMLRELAKKHSLVYALGDDPYAKYYDFVVNPAQKDTWKQLDKMFNDVQDCRQELARLRAIKQPEEIAAIKKAIALTTIAFEKVKKDLYSFKYEYEIEAEFTHHFRRSGATGHAYDPIVASGKNACTLHYNANNDKLKRNNLLLLDIGARVDGYAADITRTYAIGEPTKRQQQVHAAVMKAHAAIITLLEPGLSVTTYQHKVDKIMTETLMGLGLMSSADDENNYHKYFPHAVSHGLGVDVHDALGRPTEFVPGMVLTVEPGIYIPKEGIGVRIEDDILITETGHQNLSAKLSTSL